MKILIVDDGAQIRRLLSAMFACEGLKVKTTADGAEAITLCESDTCDAVAPDFQLAIDRRLI